MDNRISTAAQLEAQQGQLDLLLAGLVALCRAVPRETAAGALASLTRRAGELAERGAGPRDEAQSCVLAPLLEALLGRAA